MDKLTILFAFFAALGVATERITEVIKGFVPWLAFEQKGMAEELRKAAIHILAIVIGSLLASQTYSQLPTSFGLPAGGFVMYLLLGAIASGGSGLWNSALDIVREVNKQKQILTDKLKVG
jgi:hypothetical protein